jgi:tetratricopeptide (TPR) repeat protein
MEPLERAVTEIRDKNYGSAIRLLEMLTGRDPSNADAFKHLSQAYYQTGEVEKAAEAGQRYAALRPTDATGHHNLGVLLARLGQTEAAERAFRAALSAPRPAGPSTSSQARARRPRAGPRLLRRPPRVPVQPPWPRRQSRNASECPGRRSWRRC